MTTITVLLKTEEIFFGLDVHIGFMAVRNPLQGHVPLRKDRQSLDGLTAASKYFMKP
jgi:hypothetical protein